MTLGELQRTVAVAPSTHQFDSSRIVHEGMLLGVCRGLIVVEDVSRMVRLVRKSPIPFCANVC